MKQKIFLITALALLVMPFGIQAANFSIGLGQPKTPTNQNSLKLTFVAGTTDPDLVITVKCYKKGPSDAVFTQFDTDKVMIPGGNTDICNITSSILSTQGSYSFYVTATADSTTQTSSTVNVEYNTSGPSDPSNYSKERINSCDYRIKFKTANDGKTIKVQLFRSDNLSIQVNAGSVVASKTVGPNTESEIVNSVPDCNKDYYFVIRAVDSSDNVSGTVGDRFTTTTTTSTSTTSTTGSGTAESAGSVGGSGAIVIAGDASQVTEQSSTESGATPAVIDDSGISPSPEVLGSATDSKKNLYKWLLIFTAALAGYFITRSLRQTKK